jgi:hypothetical protein
MAGVEAPWELIGISPERGRRGERGEGQGGTASGWGGGHGGALQGGARPGLGLPGPRYCSWCSVVSA